VQLSALEDTDDKHSTKNTKSTKKIILFRFCIFVSFVFSCLSWLLTLWSLVIRPEPRSTRSALRNPRSAVSAISAVKRTYSSREIPDDRRLVAGDVTGIGVVEHRGVAGTG